MTTPTAAPADLGGSGPPAAPRGPRHLEVLRRGRRARGRLADRPGGRDQLPARRQRRRQVDPDQDPVGRPSSPTRERSPSTASRSSSARPATRSTPASRPSTRTSSVMPLMSISRNFFLGNEPTVGFGPLPAVRLGKAADIAREEMHNIGIDVRDTEQLVGTLSGGERQTLAIARAEYFGAKVLILDEPTSALGVKESAIVLRHAIAARNRGLGVIFITHNVQHALPIGDSFTILSRGRIRSGPTGVASSTPSELHRADGRRRGTRRASAGARDAARRESARRGRRRRSRLGEPRRPTA